MIAEKGLGMKLRMPPPVPTAILLVLLFFAQPLPADQAAETAFQILETYVQGREIALETGNRGLAAFGLAAGSGLLVGSTWGGLIPALHDSEPEEDWGYGIAFGLGTSAGANILAVSIANLVYPPLDMRSEYSSVLDVVDPVERERAAVSVLKHFSEQSKKRRKLGAILSVMAIASPIAAHLGVSQATGYLRTDHEVALGFSLAAAGCLYFTMFYLWDEDEKPRLYERYLGEKP